MQMQTSFTGKKMSGTKNLFQRLFVTPWKQHEPSSDSSIPGWRRRMELVLLGSWVVSLLRYREEPGLKA
ncbi:hypothetical protein Golax_016493 [Gossypium laxum]|uniref:Uncharacterized protein n=1 Tax=Gossypium laxum TaxID=34288 RepID=A0A7J8YXH6_9ROSI|nr:hypothetical protein [Gossypium laxum]